MPVLTIRAVLGLVIVSLMIGFSYLWSPLAIVAGISGLALLGAMAIDFFATPGREDFEVRREIMPKLSLGDENEVVLNVAGKRKQNVRLRITDNVPVEFQLRNARFDIRLAGGETASRNYTVRPIKRGVYRFETVSLRIFGLLGLIDRIHHVPVPKDVKVYPSYLQVKKYQLHSKRMNLEMLGKKKQRRYGEGREFESLREYTLDDEYRKINWKATARRGKPIVSQYQIERNQNVIILLDAGRMMRTKAGDMTKLDHAINATLMLSFICVNKEDNVGLMVFNSKVSTFLPPVRGRNQLNRINEALYNVDFEFSEPNYRAAFQAVRRKISRRSLVVLITDLIDDRASEVLIREFTALYPQHLPLCITLKDRSVDSLALQVPESTEDILEMGVAQMLLEERLKALRFLRLNGVLTLDTQPEDLTAQAINKYIEIKARSLI